jgi:hypothetical protein
VQAPRCATSRAGSRPGSTVVFHRGSAALKLDNQSVTFDSPSGTVDELLQSYNVHLQGDDFVVPAPTTVLSHGATVTFVRVGADVTHNARPIQYDTVQQPDPDLPIGQTRVIQDGVNGTMTVTYRQRIENGQKGDRTIVSEVPTVEPKSRIIGYGTYADPHWDRLAQCSRVWDTVDPTPTADGGRPSTVDLVGVRRASSHACRLRQTASSDHRGPASTTRWVGTRGAARTTCCTGRGGACDLPEVASHSR